MRVVVASLVALSWSVPAPAQVPARPPAAWTLHDAVEAAWARLPQTRSIAARQSVAAANYRAGSAVFPNAPAATGTFANDRIVGSNYGYVTSQVELSTPVWLPGEGTATQDAAKADGQVALADRDALHLAVAERVLLLTEQVEAGANQISVATQRLAVTRALATSVRQRFTVGEAPETDALAADAETSNAELAVGTARAQAGAALAAFAVLTGSAAAPRLDVGPGDTPPCPLALDAGPVPPAIQAVLEANPTIIAGRRAVEAAEAKARLVRIENRDNPEIGVQGLDEKQPGTRWDTRMIVTFRFPFATEARNAPRRAAADQAVIDAQVRLEQARRDALAALCQSSIAVTAAERNQAAAARSAALLDQRRVKIERAWRAGEIALIEVFRANSMAFDADLARDRAATSLAAARIRAQLAQGVLP